MFVKRAQVRQHSNSWRFWASCHLFIYFRQVSSTTDTAMKSFEKVVILHLFHHCYRSNSLKIAAVIQAYLKALYLP